MPANLSAMTWWDYVQRATNGATQESIARAIDVSTPTVGRWQSSTPKPQNVAAFARRYGRPVLEAFIAAGFLTEEEARAQVTVERFESPSDELLLDLISKRLEQGREESGGDGRDAAPTIGGEDLFNGLGEVVLMRRRASVVGAHDALTARMADRLALSDVNWQETHPEIYRTAARLLVEQGMSARDALTAARGIHAEPWDEPGDGNATPTNEEPPAPVTSIHKGHGRRVTPERRPKTGKPMAARTGVDDREPPPTPENMSQDPDDWKPSGGDATR